MRVIAFLISILGLGFLIGSLLKGPLYVESLDGLIVGRVVEISGIVESERKFGSGKLLIVGEIPVFCECYGSYAGLEVVVSGVVEKFPEDFRIRAFTIEILD